MDKAEIERAIKGPRWGYMQGDQFIPLPKVPLLNADLGPPPFAVELPSGQLRHVIEEPSS